MGDLARGSAASLAIGAVSREEINGGGDLIHHAGAQSDCESRRALSCEQSRFATCRNMTMRARAHAGAGAAEGNIYLCIEYLEGEGGRRSEVLWGSGRLVGVGVGSHLKSQGVVRRAL